MQPVDDRGREVARLLTGRYEVLGLLGRGGFATVYQVRNLRLQRIEALKVVAGSHDETSEFLRRFEQESRVAASLEHPNILKVYDFGHDAGTLWYSMPFVDGPTLTTELRRRGTFEEEAAVRIIVPLLDALEYSHGRGVIHRDIKLDNILLDRRDRPYLMDFGIAKTDDSLVKTQTGLVLGSPAYISPEQLRGDRLDGRTDVYSLGVSLFQMVAGAVPFRSDRMADLADRIVVDAPRLSARRPGVSRELDRIVARALARSRDERYPGAREMRLDLEAFLDSRRAAPGAAAADPASLEETAALSTATLPPIAIPAPPSAPAPTPAPTRRSSAQIAAQPRPTEQPAAPTPGPSHLAVVAAAVAAGLLAIAAVIFLLRRSPPGPLPAPTPLPTSAPVAAPAIPTPVLAVLPTPPAPATAVPEPAPSPARAAKPEQRPGRATSGREPRRTAPPPPAAAAPTRRIKTPPRVEEQAEVALSPEQQRACGGKVVGIAVVIGQDGSVLSKRVISSASSTCDALALEILSHYRFRPALDDAGRPVEGRFAVPVSF
jgi:serine/threonine-protein kinase